LFYIEKEQEVLDEAIGLEKVGFLRNVFLAAGWWKWGIGIHLLSGLAIPLKH